MKKNLNKWLLAAVALMYALFMILYGIFDITPEYAIIFIMSQLMAVYPLITTNQSDGVAAIYSLLYGLVIVVCWLLPINPAWSLLPVCIIVIINCLKLKDPSYQIWKMLLIIFTAFVFTLLLS